MSVNGTSAKRIYADHAATTPAREEVIAAMLPFLGSFNPSSIYAEGRRARAALDEARERVARALGATPREIVFTGGGTESIVLAILGAARARRHQRRHVVTAATEHRAVLGTVALLREDGFEVTLLPVDRNGCLDPGRLAEALRDDTALVSLMLGNNELGTIHPIAEFAATAHERGAIVHTDAIQAPGRHPLDVRTLGVDLMSLASHKFYGPKGVGALYVRNETPLASFMVGGGQEFGLRGGTEDVAGVVGLATALELATKECERETLRLETLREHFESNVQATIPGVRINAGSVARLPHISSLSFSSLDSPTLLIRLDLEGIAASAGSACASGAAQPSHVLRAIESPESAARGTVRFSFGRLCGRQEVAALLAMLPNIVASVRSTGASSEAISEVRS